MERYKKKIEEDVIALARRDIIDGVQTFIWKDIKTSANNVVNAMEDALNDVSNDEYNLFIQKFKKMINKL